jgi:hypothetical protein
MGAVLPPGVCSPLRIVTGCRWSVDRAAERRRPQSRDVMYYGRLRARYRNRALSWWQPELRLLSKLLDDWVDANTVSVNNPLYCCEIVSITIQQIQAAIGLARFQAMARRSTAIAPLAKAAHADQAPRRTAHPRGRRRCRRWIEPAARAHVRRATADDPRAARRCGGEQTVTEAVWSASNCAGIPHSYAGAISS